MKEKFDIEIKMVASINDIKEEQENIKEEDSENIKEEVEIAAQEAKKEEKDDIIGEDEENIEKNSERQKMTGSQ